MKIPTIQQIREADAYTIQHEPIESIDLMERAARLVYQKMLDMFDKETNILIVCGMGNNGGDGLALARMLLENNYQCSVALVKHSDKFSNDCAVNLERLQKKYGDTIKTIENKEDIPSLNYDVIVDAVLGSGLNKTVTDDVLCHLFQRINQSSAFVFSIDIPSGLFANQAIDFNASIVKADFVFTFQFPKLSFLFPEYYDFVGEWEVGDIGLHDAFINKIETPFYFAEEKDIVKYIQPRLKFSHKGTHGRALLVAGSKGMMGAAVLGAKACLRSGLGLVEVHVPKTGVEILQSTVPEALCSCDTHEEYMTNIPFEKLSNVNAIAIGPGIGKSEETANGLKNLIYNAQMPIIFDADAINIMAENKTWLEYLPANCIFTPHLKEFERLVGKSRHSYERLQLQREFSNKYRCVTVVKGAHSSISLPNGDVFFNSTGNPGMATAGSGDVLTGILLGLSAQHYTAAEAAILGVYLHGRAGDMALERESYESLIASDIIEALGKAWKL